MYKIPKAMKRMLIHTIPAVISFIWLITVNNTLNPFSLKGPDFLRFYLILIFGYYTSAFVLKHFRKEVSEIILYCLSAVFLVGTIKLIIGISLGKPVGFLIIILILELNVFLIIKRSYLRFKLK